MASRVYSDLNTNKVLTAFLDCLARAFEIKAAQATFFITQNSEALKALILLGGKDNQTVVKMFELLETTCDDLVRCASRDPSEAESLENLIHNLSFSMLSKVQEIFEEGCLFFESLLQACSRCSDREFSDSLLKSIVLKDAVLMKNVRLAIEFDSTRTRPIVELFSEDSLISLLSMHLSSIDSYDEYITRIQITKFYLAIVEEMEPTSIPKLMEKLLYKFSDPSSDYRFQSLVAGFLLEAETIFLSKGLPNAVGYTDFDSTLIINKLLHVFRDRIAGLDTCLRVLVCWLDMAAFVANQNLSRTFDIIQTQNYYLPHLLYESVGKLMEVSLCCPFAAVKALLFNNLALRSTPLTMLDQFFTALKKHAFKHRQKFQEEIDSDMLSVFKFGTSRLSEISRESRVFVFEFLIEHMNHQLHFREVLTLLVVFILDLQDVDFNPDTLLRAAKQVSKELVQVKYSNLNSKYDSSSLNQMSKLFKISMQLTFVVHVVALARMDAETGRFLLNTYKRIQEASHELPFHRDVLKIVGLLEEFDDGVLRPAQAQSRANPYKIHNPLNSRTLSPKRTPNKVALPAIPPEHKVQPEGFSLAKTLEEISPTNNEKSSKTATPHARIGTGVSLSIDNRRTETFNTLVKTPHLYSMNTSMSNNLADEYSRNLTAKKRVISALNKSQMHLNGSLAEVPNPHISLNVSLVKQVKDWQDLPLVEKTKMITLKREIKQTDKDASLVFSFKPETNPAKHSAVVVEFNSKSDPPAQAISLPFSQEFEDEKTLRAVRICIHKNSHLLRQVFDTLVAFKKLKVIDKKLIPVSSFSYLLKAIDLGPLITSDECKTLIQRIKNGQKEIQDALGINLEEFKLMLIHCADLFVRKCPELGFDLLQGLEHLLQETKDKFAAKAIASSHPGDPEIIQYLASVRPAVLPLVLSYDQELRILQRASLPHRKPRSGRPPRSAAHGLLSSLLRSGGRPHSRVDRVADLSSENSGVLPCSRTHRGAVD